MATNVFGTLAGQPNAVVSLVSASFLDMGLNSDNTLIIYIIDDPLKSWKPNRAINGITGIVPQKGYYLIAKEDMDLTAYFVPPVSSGGGNTPIVNAGANQDLAANVSTANLSGGAVPPAGSTIVSYLWLVVSYPEIWPRPVFTTPASNTTTVTGLKPGTYIFQLQATDSSGFIGVDQMQTIVAQPDAIFVNAGIDQLLDEGTTKTNVYGTAVTSGGSEIVTWEWSVLTPGVVGVTFTTANEPNTAINGLPLATTTVFRLTVTDQFGFAFHDDINVEVMTPSTMEHADGGGEYIYDTTLEMRLYLYEPQGYKVDRPTKYPLYIFLHGNFVNGDVVSPVDDVTKLLIQSEGLPYFLFNKAYEMAGVVLMPQLHTGLWAIEQTNLVIQWALDRGINFDTNKVHITGPSSGGKGALEAVVENPDLFASALPCSPTFTNVTDPGNAFKIKDVKIRIVHSYGDLEVRPDADGSTFDVIDELNALSPQGRYSPEILMDWLPGHGFTTWNYNVYDKVRAAFDFEKDFFLRYNKNANITADNFVVIAEQAMQFKEWAEARAIVDKLAAGSTKTALLNRLSTVKNAINTARKHIFINLGSTASDAPYNLNNVTASTDGTEVTGLQDINGGSTIFSFKIVQNEQPGLITDAPNNSYNGASPQAHKSAILVGLTTQSQWQFAGLDTGKAYSIIAITSDSGRLLIDTGNRTGVRSQANYDQAQSRGEGYNTLFPMLHARVAPNLDGTIDMKLDPLYGFKGQVNALILVEHATINPRSNFGKWSFGLTNTGIDTDEWGCMLGNPHTGVRTAIDPVSGWAVNTVGVGATLWANAGGDAYASDTEAPSGTYPDEFPTAVARGAYLNNNLYFDLATQNYNIEIVGTPGMGLPAGEYRVKYLSSSATPWVAKTRVYCLIGRSGTQWYDTGGPDNTTEYISFTGVIKDGETIKLSCFAPNIFSYSFVNAIILEKIR